MIHLDNLLSLADKNNMNQPFFLSVIPSKVLASLLYVIILLRRKRYDWSFLPGVCRLKALVAWLQFIMLRHVRPARAVHFLLVAHRMLQKVQALDAPPLRLQRVIEETISQEFSKGGPAHLNPNPMTSGKVSGQDLSFLRKHGGIVLKAPRFVGGRVMEKGALLLKYGENFRSFRLYVDVAAVLQHYVLILEPGHSGYANFDILYFTRFTDYPIIVMATEKRDYHFLERLRTNLVQVSFGASDWVNPFIFRPLAGEEKRYDAVVVAAWSLVKRHHVLFRVIRDLKDPSFQIALVAPRWLSNRKEIELLIDAYGIRDNLSLFEDLTSEEVNQILNQSNVNVLLSRQEGSNRSLFEGFFAGVPGLALKNNVGIQKDYFTPQTGRLIDEKDLGSELLYFRDHWCDFDPRPWAEANIAPEITTAKLNALLKDSAEKRGEEWTQDLVAKCNCPGLRYYPDEKVGRGLPLMEEILVQYPGVGFNT